MSLLPGNGFQFCRKLNVLYGLRHFPALAVPWSKALSWNQPIQEPARVCNIVGGVLSPLLANIALNFLDWHLDELGYRFVRYADDFVILCRTEHQAKEAHQAVQRIVEQLGLTLSPEKTHITTFRKGFSFVGFDVTSHSVKMRAKSVEKYKDRIKELTLRSHNLDSKRIVKINAVVRGVARYFGTMFSRVMQQFEELDRWLRMRLRCMRTKRKRRTDNCRIKIKHLRRRGCTFLNDYRIHA